MFTGHSGYILYLLLHNFLYTYVRTYVDILIPDPDTPSIISGGVMSLTGPCFSMEIENITCLFTDKEGDVTSFTDHKEVTTKRVINGITVNEKAVCPLPLFRRLGNHNVTVTLNNGAQYSGSFNVGMYVIICIYVNNTCT